MAQRYKKKIRWSYLRYLIESNLNEFGISSSPLKVDGKIERIDGGLHHDNYRFWLTGNKWKDRPMLLRLNKYDDTGRSKKEVIDFTLTEAETLRALKKTGFKYETPEFICMVKGDSEEPEGFIETFVRGLPLSLFRKKIYHQEIITCIAEVAAAIHQLPLNQFQHLGSHRNNNGHVDPLLDKLSQDLYDEFPSIQKAMEWIDATYQKNESSVVLHGDLLPQNLLSDPMKDFKISVVDWEFARTGDPAYDLAIVSRGNRKVLGKQNGLKRLLKSYKEAGGQNISLIDVMAYELILVLNWIWESSESRKKGEQNGHGPDYYERKMISILQRAENWD